MPSSAADHLAEGTMLTAKPEYTLTGADNSLARPGRKKFTATEDFDVRISYL